MVKQRDSFDINIPDVDELAQVPARNLDNYVVEAGFKTSSCLVGDRVDQLRQCDVKRQLGSNVCQGIPAKKATVQGSNITPRPFIPCGLAGQG